MKKKKNLRPRVILKLNNPINRMYKNKKNKKINDRLENIINHRVGNVSR